MLIPLGSFGSAESWIDGLACDLSRDVKRDGLMAWLWDPRRDLQRDGGMDLPLYEDVILGVDLTLASPLHTDTRVGGQWFQSHHKTHSLPRLWTMACCSSMGTIERCQFWVMPILGDSSQK